MLHHAHHVSAVEVRLDSSLKLGVVEGVEGVVEDLEAKALELRLVEADDLFGLDYPGVVGQNGDEDDTR